MNEATQEQVEEAISELEEDYVEDNDDYFNDPAVGEDGTFNLENEEIVTDGGYNVDVVETGENYAILESEGETYLIEEASVEEDGTHVFEVIDNETVCRPGSEFKSPDRVRMTSYDMESVSSYEQAAREVFSKSSSGEKELEELLEF